MSYHTHSKQDALHLSNYIATP